MKILRNVSFVVLVGVLVVFGRNERVKADYEECGWYGGVNPAYYAGVTMDCMLADSVCEQFWNGPFDFCEGHCEEVCQTATHVSNLDCTEPEIGGGDCFVETSCICGLDAH